MNNIDKQYIDRFIKSMIDDKAKWTMNSFTWMDGPFYSFFSPKYGKIQFKFGTVISPMCDSNDNIWYVPDSVLYNPFNRYYWKFRKAKKELKSFHFTKQKNEYYNKLQKELNKNE